MIQFDFLFSHMFFFQPPTTHSLFESISSNTCVFPCWPDARVLQILIQKKLMNPGGVHEEPTRNGGSRALDRQDGQDGRFVQTPFCAEMRVEGLVYFFEIEIGYIL